MSRFHVTCALSALFLAGCLFPSFDDMRGPSSGAREERSQDEVPATETMATTTRTSPEAGTASNTGDVAAVSPGAGKIACANDTCAVGPNSHCCADYTLAPGPYCSSPSHTIGWCTGGGGRALFCDEKADCPGAQVCCEKDKVASCSATCTGGKVLP